MIRSRQNRRLKDIRRLRHCKGERALLEGPHLVSEALAAGIELEMVFASPDFLSQPAGRRLAERLPRAAEPLAAELLEALADADSPRGILAVARLPRLAAADLPVRPRGVYLFLDGIQDPGNLGALARVAEAAGVAGLALGEGTAHPNHPRALRASAGSLLRLPVALGAAPDEVAARLAAMRPRWVALQPLGGQPLYGARLAPPLVLVLGAEGPGLSARLLERADLRLSIPMAAPVESLNVAVAAALVLFEIRRREASFPAPARIADSGRAEG